MESVSYLKISIRHLNPTMRKRKPHLNIIEIQSRSQCPGFGFWDCPVKGSHRVRTTQLEKNLKKLKCFQLIAQPEET